MADPFGIVSFPGLVQVVSAQFSLTHGISPSVCSIQCAPQPPNFRTDPGLLTFQFGNARLQFPNCIIDDFQETRGQQGIQWTLQIVDRRWKWKYAEPIWGHYNMRLENGELARGDAPGESTTFFAPSLKTPQQLARLCLEKMREQGANVSELPNNVYPETFWDFVNPAEALQSLCESLGCRIVLGLDNRVAIRKIGRGRNLPNDPSMMEDSLSLDLQAKPDSIWCVCAHARWQVDFKLEAVGLDTDGEIKLIDKLSYKPSGGWANADLIHFQGLANNSATVRKLAQECVFRWYRVTCPSQIPGYGPLEQGIHQIMLEDEQVEQMTMAAVGVGTGKPIKRNKPAQVHGKWWMGNEDLKDSDTELKPPTSEDKLYTRGFSIDRGRRLVRFSDQVFSNSEHSPSNTTPAKVGIQPAELVLRTACIVLQNDTLAPVRYVRYQSFGKQNGTGPHQLRHEELILGTYPRYSSTPGTYRNQVQVGSVPIVNNRLEIDAQALQYILAAMDDFQARVPQARTYAGLHSISPDGAIQQVAWFVGPQGTVTRASRNTEQVDLSMSFSEKRFNQKISAFLKKESANELQKKRDRRRAG